MTTLPVATVDRGQELGLSWGDLLLVVLSATGIYAAVVLLTRLTGPRPIGSFSTFDIVVSVAMGSLVGRVVLAAVFERDAEVAVIHRDTPLDPRMLVDVTGVPAPAATAAHQAARKEDV